LIGNCDCMHDRPQTGAAAPIKPRRARDLAQRNSKSTTDHSQLEALKGPFKSGPEVTKACLSCHNMAGHQVMKSVHWTWEAVNPTTGKTVGKKITANNFCGSPLSNEARCTSCHAGYGWKDKNFDLPGPGNVDCLVCHDNTGTYKKFGTDAGHPLVRRPRVRAMEGPPGKKLFKAPDLTKIAQNVGKPGRANCGACHFSGGGGDAVKHGDLDSSLKNPSRELDVHMAKDGANMVCADCHTFNAHSPPAAVSPPGPKTSTVWTCPKTTMTAPPASPATARHRTRKPRSTTTPTRWPARPATSLSSRAAALPPKCCGTGLPPARWDRTASHCLSRTSMATCRTQPPRATSNTAKTCAPSTSGSTARQPGQHHRQI
jgi:hypothetical protein